MGPFYLIITELLLWFSIFLTATSLVYVIWNYASLIKPKLKVKKVSLTFNLIFAFLILFLTIMLILGCIWTYVPSNFGYTFTTIAQISSSIIYTVISFVFSIGLVIYLFFFGKYFFIAQKKNGQIILFGFGVPKTTINFKFKKTLVNKEYQQLLKK